MKYKLKFCILITVILASSLVMAEKLKSPSVPERFVFGAIAPATNVVDYYDSTISMEFGAGVFFNKWIGLFAGFHLALPGPQKKWWFDMKDPELGWLLAHGDVTPSRAVSFNVGVIIKRNIGSKFYTFVKTGYHYTFYDIVADAILEVDADPRMGTPAIYQELSESFSKNQSGLVGTWGFGIKISNELDVTVDFTLRQSNLDEEFEFPQEIRLYGPVSELPSGFSVGFQYRFSSTR